MGTEKGPGPPPGRFASLDFFRGLTVAGMIFVNNPGDWGHLYPPFGHAEWHGWTPTDLIFPFFLFIVGTAGVFSLTKRMERGATRAALARHAVSRGMTIVLVGWAMAWFPFTLERLARLRIPGVLPRIGVVYVLGTLLILAVWKRRVPGLFLATGVLLALHTFLLTGLGFDLTPEGNIQKAVDLAVLRGHLWKKEWDPEGIVSTLTAVATMLTGTLAGFVLTRKREGGTAPDLPGAVGRLLLWGAAGIAAGLLGSVGLPINKNLWTGSYVLFTSGCACAGLALSIVVVDLRARLGPNGFFFTFGRNPLVAFVGSGMLAKILGLVKLPVAGGKAASLQRLLYDGGFSWIGDPTLRSHAFALVTVLFWYGVLLVFERKGWYWKV
ncbi:MAG TPA: heparan-alpha-glucosaminide N-acetyltransferase domain-containing protein [Thermoanaerobaculia bacterium]|nr:heparan-alpha-glucosaminide N-acetyltransferase domain-containing protein [Thermoanaerobaculia bacterium]HQR66827.1 heparan-alpha-glucosaminide N-acetyltransferase domain-containing protein [Thermoanaerobaculia bacterium]